jgi:hypothetical protein
MDDETILALGKFLNEVIDKFDSCDHTLGVTEAWLLAYGHKRQAALDWLRDQGISCDCEFMLKLYIPTRDKGKPVDTKPIGQRSDVKLV